MVQQQYFGIHMLSGAGMKPPTMRMAPGYHAAPGSWYWSRGLMLVKHELGCWLAVFLLWVPAPYGQDRPHRKTFSIPNSVLLFGTYNDVRVSTPITRGDSDRRELKGQCGQFSAPSISRRRPHRLGWLLPAPDDDQD